MASTATSAAPTTPKPPSSHASAPSPSSASTSASEYGQASKKYHLPLVRRRRRGRGALLCQDLPRLIRWRGAPRARRLSVREKRRCVDGGVYGDGSALPRAQWRTRVQ